MDFKTKQVIDVYPSRHKIDLIDRLSKVPIAMDTIRLKVMRKYDKGHSKLENAEMYYYMLKKFYYFFTKNFDNIYDGNIKVLKLKTVWDKHEIFY